MSASTARVGAEPRPAARRLPSPSSSSPGPIPAVNPVRRPRLRVVPPPARRPPRTPFVVLVIAMLAGGLVGLLVLNIQRAQDAFAQATVTAHNATLTDRVQSLRIAVQQDQTPATLAARAAALGMVPGGAPVFVDRQGRVLGTTTAGAPTPATRSAEIDGVLVAGLPLSQVDAARTAGNSTATVVIPDPSKGSVISLSALTPRAATNTVTP